MKKILLINPAFKGSMHSNIKVLAIPPLNLTMIARYTPEQYDVEIVDEAVEEPGSRCSCRPSGNYLYDAIGAPGL